MQINPDKRTIMEIVKIVIHYIETLHLDRRVIQNFFVPRRKGPVVNVCLVPLQFGPKQSVIVADNPCYFTNCDVIVGAVKITVPNCENILAISRNGSNMLRNGNGCSC